MTPYPYEDDFESMDMNGAGNILRDADAALHPDGGNNLQLAMKSRVDPGIKHLVDHVMSVSIRRGLYDGALGAGVGKKLNALDALLVADQVNSIAVQGLGRDELIDMAGALPTMGQKRNQRPTGQDQGF